MTKIKKEELAVAALENGTVIDHILTQSLFKVVNLLGIKDLTSSVTIGFNLDSKKCGKKGIIKVADVFFPEKTLNRIAIVAPNAKINVIRGYEVVDKHTVTLPDDIVGIVRCGNPKCITNNEPVDTHFHVVERGDNVVLKCHYCERSFKDDEIEII